MLCVKAEAEDEAQRSRSPHRSPERVWELIEARDETQIRSWLRGRPHADLEQVDKSGNSVLIAAARTGSYAVLLNVLNVYPKQHVNHQNAFGETALFAACAGGHLPAVDALLRSGANPNTPNMYGETPFYSACYHGHISVVRRLMQCVGIRWRESGQDISPPIFIAAQRGHLEVASLIEHRQLWHVQRLLWIGHLREPKDKCPLSRLPRSVLLRIIELYSPKRRYVLSLQSPRGAN